MNNPFSAAFWRGFGSAFTLFPTQRDLTDLSSELLAPRRPRMVWRSGPAQAEPLPPPPKDPMGQERYPWYTVRPAPAPAAPPVAAQKTKHKKKRRRA